MKLKTAALRLAVRIYKSEQTRAVVLYFPCFLPFFSSYALHVKGCIQERDSNVFLPIHNGTQNAEVADGVY
jgi:hypothetical protein